MLGFTLLTLAIALEIVGQLLFKAGVSAPAKPSRTNIRGAHRSSSRRWIAAGIVAYLLELVLWIAALSSLALSKAFPLLSLSYAGVAIGAWFVFGEKLSVRGVIGIVLLTAGAALMVA